MHEFIFNNITLNFFSSAELLALSLPSEKIQEQVRYQNARILFRMSNFLRNPVFKPSFHGISIEKLVTDFDARIRQNAIFSYCGPIVTKICPETDPIALASPSSLIDDIRINPIRVIGDFVEAAFLLTGLTNGDFRFSGINGNYVVDKKTEKRAQECRRAFLYQIMNWALQEQKTVVLSPSEVASIRSAL